MNGELKLGFFFDVIESFEVLVHHVFTFFVQNRVHFVIHYFCLLVQPAIMLIQLLLRVGFMIKTFQVRRDLQQIPLP